MEIFVMQKILRMKQLIFVFQTMFLSTLKSLGQQQQKYQEFKAKWPCDNDCTFCLEISSSTSGLF